MFAAKLLGYIFHSIQNLSFLFTVPSSFRTTHGSVFLHYISGQDTKMDTKTDERSKAFPSLPVSIKTLPIKL